MCPYLWFICVCANFFLCLCVLGMCFFSSSYFCDYVYLRFKIFCFLIVYVSLYIFRCVSVSFVCKCLFFIIAKILFVWIVCASLVLYVHVCVCVCLHWVCIYSYVIVFVYMCLCAYVRCFVFSVFSCECFILMMYICVYLGLCIFVCVYISVSV